MDIAVLCRLTRRDQLAGRLHLHAVDLAQAEAQGRVVFHPAIFQCGIPGAEIHVGWPGFDAVLAGTTHDLGRGIKSHRL